MFYFKICSYSKLEAIKNEFVKAWGEEHTYTRSDNNVHWDQVVKKEARGINDAT